jgi:hypothetical protein
MTTLLHAIFGAVEFDTEDNENEWESEMEWEGSTIGLDLTFGATIDSATLDTLGRYVRDLAAFDRMARIAIHAEVAGRDQVIRDLIGSHLPEPGLVRAVFGVEDPAAVGTDAFLTALRLARVGLYTGTDVSDHEAEFEYTIDWERAPYLVVVCFNKAGTVDEVCLEN